MTALVFMKLKAGRQKDTADLVELLKRGMIAADVIDRYLGQNAPDLAPKWARAKIDSFVVQVFNLHRFALKGGPHGQFQ